MRIPISMISVILSVMGCLDSEKINYSPLEPCAFAETGKSKSDSADTMTRAVPVTRADYEVCKDSSNAVAVSIGVPGEHQIHLNGADVYAFKGISRIWINGPFQDGNEITIIKNETKVFTIHFLKPG